MFQILRTKFTSLSLVFLLVVVSKTTAKNCHDLLDKRQTDHYPLPSEIEDLLPRSYEETSNCRFDLFNLSGQEALIKQLADDDADYKFCLGCGRYNDGNICHSVEVCDEDAVCINGSHADPLHGLFSIGGVTMESWHGCCRPDKSKHKCTTHNRDISIDLPGGNFTADITYSLKICQGTLCNAGPQLTDKVKLFKLAMKDPTALHSWGIWGAWSSCNCVTNEDVRNRACQGTSCFGFDLDTRECVNNLTCPVNGGWNNFTDWSACDVTCNGGNQSRVRSCANPTPANGGAYCHGNHQEIRRCNTQACPEWKAWSTWSSCFENNVECWKTRSRHCSTGHNAQCTGQPAEAHLCGQNDCYHAPVDGGWSRYSEWYSCSATCGNSTQVRVRYCNNPSPSGGGKPCVGDSVQRQSCNTDSCPYWLPWEPLSNCKLANGACLSYRLRNCSTGSDNDCDGSNHDIVPCKPDDCIPKWSAWTMASPCQLYGPLCLSHIIRNCSTGRKSDCSGGHYQVLTCLQQCCDPNYNGTGCGLKSPIATSSSTPVLTSTTTSSPSGSILIKSTSPKAPVGTRNTSGLVTSQGGLSHTSMVVTSTSLPVSTVSTTSINTNMSTSSASMPVTTTSDMHMKHTNTASSGYESTTDSSLTSSSTPTIRVPTTSSSVPSNSTITSGLTFSSMTNSSSTYASFEMTTNKVVPIVSSTQAGYTSLSPPMTNHYLSTTHPSYSSTNVSRPVFTRSPMTVTTAVLSTSTNSRISAMSSTPTATTTVQSTSTNSTISAMSSFPTTAVLSTSNYSIISAMSSIPTFTVQTTSTNSTISAMSSFPTTTVQSTSTNSTISAMSPTPTSLNAALTTAMAPNATLQTTQPHNVSLTTIQSSNATFTAKRLANSSSIKPATTYFPLVTLKALNMSLTTPKMTKSAVLATLASNITFMNTSKVTSNGAMSTTNMSLTASKFTIPPTIASKTTFMYTSSVTPTGVISTTRPALTVAHNSTQTVIASSQTFVSTSLSNGTVPPHVRTTKPMVTIPPKEIQCAICSGPPEACELAYYEDTCQPPNHYCINHVTNKANGKRLVERRCGNITDCYHDWYLGSSDDDKCRQLSANTVLTYNFECSYCCIKDGCNVDLHPKHDTLYMNM